MDIAPILRILRLNYEHMEELRKNKLACMAKICIIGSTESVRKVFLYYRKVRGNERCMIAS